MKIKLCLLAALCLLPAFAQQDSRSFTAVLLAVGTTATYGMQPSALNHTVQANIVGSPSACAIQLEGSLDGVTWNNLSGTQACTSSTMFHVDGKAVPYVRINLTSFTGGTSVTAIYRGSN